jgi:hypothetical protein
MRMVGRAVLVAWCCGCMLASASELTPFPKSSFSTAPPDTAVDQFKAAIASFSCAQLAETNKGIEAKATAATTAQDKAYYARLIGVIAEARVNSKCPPS